MTMRCQDLAFAPSKCVFSNQNRCLHNTICLRNREWLLEYQRRWCRHRHIAASPSHINASPHALVRGKNCFIGVEYTDRCRHAERHVNIITWSHGCLRSMGPFIYILRLMSISSLRETKCQLEYLIVGGTR